MTLVEESPSSQGSLARLGGGQSATETGPAGTAQIGLDELRLSPSLRAGGIDTGHVEALKELEGRWPPIVVSSSDRTVVDGLHRVHAALGLGLRRVTCTYFTGDEDEIYVEFVQRNTAHGLPLSFAEREAAAGRLLRRHADWSDRRIASTCALAPATVARLRRAPATTGLPAKPCSTACREQLATRVGRDGRIRPVDPGAVRIRIAEALRSDPEASLRQIASRIGTSPATVRSVRFQLAAENVVRDHDDATGATGLHQTDPRASSAEDTLVDRSLATRSGWAPDRAVLSTDEGSDFAAWFTRTAVDDSWWSLVGAVPVSRIYEIADEARMRAGRWHDFARALEARAKPR
ncbi:MAG: hypothetical protein JWO37_3785 [Acidimicrobiales bacterium]|jgi:ParB-like chromosome segregation protein Spo0J|nr:hypothetical protein [Acidimicrobiales bacterium]